MRIAILTFDGFNELDSFVALGMLNRMRPKGWLAEIVGPGERIVSGNGVAVTPQQPLEFAAQADIVLFGSGRKTLEIAADRTVMDRLRLDPARQLVGAQCSGTLLMAKLGLLGTLPACTDLTTRPWVVESGANVVDASFHAEGNRATAGGCLASQYLATWVLLKCGGEAAAIEVLNYVAPVDERDAYTTRLLDKVRPFIQARARERVTARA